MPISTSFKNSLANLDEPASEGIGKSTSLVLKEVSEYSSKYDQVLVKKYFIFRLVLRSSWQACFL